MSIPAQDPQFVAFLRASGAQEADLANMAAFQKQRVTTGHALRLPEYGQDLRDGQRKIMENFAGRGMARSGTRAARQNEQASDVEHSIQKDRITTQGDVDQIDVTLAQQIAELRRQAADKGLDATAKTTLGNARGVLSPLGA